MAHLIPLPGRHIATADPMADPHASPRSESETDEFVRPTYGVAYCRWCRDAHGWRYCCDERLRVLRQAERVESGD